MGALLTTCASANPREFPDDHSVEPEAGVEDNEYGPRDDGYEAEEDLFGGRVLRDKGAKNTVVQGRRTKIRTAQLSNWISCGGRMEYHAMPPVVWCCPVIKATITAPWSWRWYLRSVRPLAL